jgi:hypothetical protein
MATMKHLELKILFSVVNMFSHNVLNLSNFNFGNSVVQQETAWTTRYIGGVEVGL